LLAAVIAELTSVTCPAAAKAPAVAKPGTAPDASVVTSPPGICPARFVEGDLNMLKKSITIMIPTM
jgi:hypothetical protein